MTGSGPLAGAAMPSRDWQATYEHLRASDDLDVGDVELLAVAAHLVGHDDESHRAWERAQRAYVELGDMASASRCAFWLGLTLLLGGRAAQADGWLARAERLATDAGTTCAIQGFVLIPQFLRVLWGGASEEADRLAERMMQIASQCRDRELLAFALLCRGEAQLAAGATDDGMRMLDEAMVAVTAGDVSPIPAGILYCAVIEACVDTLDLRRAAEWTEALDRWCREQSGVVPYRGACLVHRAQVLQARGAWDAALSEASAALELLAAHSHPAVGSACYQLAELHRLRGDFGDAMRAYNDANGHGRDPAPGMLLLRVAEGRAASAVSSVERMIDQSRGLRTFPTMLSAAVEVLLAAGQVDAARSAAGELARIADAGAPPLLVAAADYAVGSVRLADGEPEAAIGLLRRAAVGWQAMDLPFETARARVQIALASRALGDEETATVELETARAVFDRLGAQPESSRVAALQQSRASAAAGASDDPLTAREREVLQLVATGATNRQIARELHISEHTVARHLQNVFTKLGISSRAAATSYAHAHGLI